jgi:uncharacterized membrane protein YhhN
MKQRIIISVGVIGVLLYFTGLAVDNYILRIVTKPLPLLTLLILLKPYTHFRKYIFTGLVFSLLGDILLESSSSMFIFGLSAFLMGHIAYIVAFTGRSHKIDLLSLGLLIVSGIIIYFVLYPGLNNLAFPVLLYIIVILAMSWRAIAQRNFDKYAGFAAIGSILFVFSDSIIAINKFTTSIPYARFIIMITYWTAQSFIFYSAYKTQK